MKTSQRGLEIIKEFEGFSATAYQCSAGVWTIGFGHTGDINKNDKITKARAEEILKQDVRNTEYEISRLVKVDLTQDQFDALVSLVYNIGAGAFAKSTLLRLLNKGDYNGASQQFARWNKVGGKPNKGLTRRRAAEAELFMDGDDGMPQAVDNPNKPIAKTRTVKTAIPAAVTGIATVAAGAAETVAPAVPVVGEVAQIAQENTHGILIVIGLILVAFAIYMVYLKFDDNRKH